MPTGTADPDRIRRIRREAVFARFADGAVLAADPAAKDGFNDVRESLFDNVADAQGLIDELANGDGVIPGLASTRGHEAAETAEPMGIGTDIDIVPVLPLARMIDNTIDMDVNQVIKGISIDFHTERNSVETIG